MDGQEDIAKAISNCRSQWSEAPDQPISQIAHFTRAHLYEGRVDFGRAGLKVVTIEIIQIVTTIIVTTFKRCNNLNML